MKYPEFPNHEKYTQIQTILNGECDGEVCVRGWIYRTRSSGKLAFIVLRDSTGNIQSTVSKKNVSESAFLDARKALIESSVIVKGIPAKDDRAPGGWEIRATDFQVVHFAETFPGFIKIFAWLVFWTILEVLAIVQEFDSFALNMLILFGIALIKCWYICSFFMHMTWDPPLVYQTAAVPLFFLAVLFLAVGLTTPGAVDDLATIALM